MTLNRRIAIGYDPTITTPANVPSYAHELPEVRLVTLSHPSNDRFHPAVRAAVVRYEAKGWSTLFLEAA